MEKKRSTEPAPLDFGCAAVVPDPVSVVLACGSDACDLPMSDVVDSELVFDTLLSDAVGTVDG